MDDASHSACCLIISSFSSLVFIGYTFTTSDRRVFMTKQESWTLWYKVQTMVIKIVRENYVLQYILHLLTHLDEPKKTERHKNVKGLIIRVFITCTIYKILLYKFLFHHSKHTGIRWLQFWEVITEIPYIPWLLWQPDWFSILSRLPWHDKLGYRRTSVVTSMRSFCC